MAIGENRYLRSFAISCIVVVLPILIKMSKLRKRFLGEDDVSILLAKVFIDILILLCFMLCYFRRNKTRKWFVLITPFIVLKCIDVLVFIVGATLLLKFGSTEDVFGETSMVLVLAVILYIGYWLSVLFLYVFATFYKTNLFGTHEMGVTNHARKKQHPIINFV